VLLPLKRLPLPGRRALPEVSRRVVSGNPTDVSRGITIASLLFSADQPK
jgi:hypothetical protein